MEAKFVRRHDMERKYIVHEMVEGERCVTLKNAYEIFDMMDMDDCYDIDIDIYEFTEFGEAPVHRNFRGTWSHMDEPLRMEITDDDGNVLAYGYGTDH